MMFEGAEIKDELICPICNFKFDDPRILPCGFTCCDKCIRKIAQEESNDSIKCPSCASSHQAPNEKGYPPNSVVAKLIEKGLTELFRSEQAKTLKESLDSLQVLLQEANDIQNDPVAIRRDYCDNIRREIDLAAETQILAIQNNRASLLEQISEFETKNFELDSQDVNKNDSSKLVQEAKDFCNKWLDDLKKLKIGDEALKKASKEASERKSQIEVRLRNQKEMAFKTGQIKFHKNLKDPVSNILGTLETEKYQITKQTEKINLSRVLADNGQSFKGNFYVDILDNQTFFLAFLNNSEQMTAFVVDQNGAILASSKNLAGYLVEWFHFCSSNKFIYLLAKPNGVGNQYPSVQVFDHRLKLLKQKIIETSYFFSMFAFNSNLGILTYQIVSKNGFFEYATIQLYLSTFDENLNKITAFQTTDATVSKRWIGVRTESSSEFFFFSAGNKFFLIDIARLKKKEFSFDSQSCTLLDQTKILVLDEFFQIFKTYDMDGKLLTKSPKLVVDTPVKQLWLKDNSELFFLDSDRLILYRKKYND